MKGGGPWRDWRAWVALARLSNLPTVWSNVLVGLALGHVALDRVVPMSNGARPWVAAHEPFELGAMLRHGGAMLIAMSLVYIAGMILNDVFDLHWDRARRPGRPLAAGRIPVRTAAGAAIALLIGALLLLMIAYARWPLMALAAALVAAVLGYDWLHKRWAGAAVLMGASRAGVYLTAAAVVASPMRETWWHTVGPVALLMGGYVVVVTFIAARETARELGARRWLAVLLFVTPLLALLVMPAVPGEGAWLQLAVVGAMVGGWLGYALGQVLARPARLDRAVPAWLAGIALIDAWLLVLLGVPMAAAGAGTCFALSVIAQRWIAAT